MFYRLDFTSFLLALTSVLVISARAQAQFAANFPGTIPLFQKTPLFGSWISAANDSLIANAAPFSWTGLPQNYVAHVRVDGKQFQWLGYRDNVPAIGNATTQGVSISPTRTVLTVKAGPVTFNATFLTPIEPYNMSNQSFPFVYLSLQAWSTDNNNHDVQFYVEMAAEFVRGSEGPVTWNTTRTNDLVYHQIFNPQLVILSEDKDTAMDGTLYFATSTATTGLSHQAGPAGEVRNMFFTSGLLSNETQQYTRLVNKDHPVIAFATSSEATPTASSPMVFALGYLRDPVVRYSVNGGVELRHSYFWTQFPKFEDALIAFVLGFPTAITNAISLDGRIMNEANQISADYGDVVALSLRQTMGAIEITAVENADGSWKEGDVKIFMRDNGLGRRTNAVETVYAAFPAFLYLNPQLARHLLESLLEYQNSPVYRNNFAAPDLGVSFPDVLGNNTDTLLYAIENCGFMLTMTLAHAMKSGDGTLLREKYNLLKTWGDYLVTYTMRADGYISSDGLKQNGLSNMALSGIAGIYAMGKINEALEPQGMLGNFTRHFINTATQYATDWASRAFLHNHIVSTYDTVDTLSYTMAHNLFAMKLLNGNYIKDEVLDGHAAQLKLLLEDSNYRYGVPYDSSSPEVRVKTHWTFLAAASLKDTSTRDALIALIHRRPFTRSFNRDANPTTFSALDGGSATGFASAAQGAAFALLALNAPNIPITIPVIRVDQDRAAIAGGIVGGVVGVLLVAWGIYLYMRRRRKLKEDSMDVGLTKESRPGTPPNTTEAGVIVPYLGITPDVENNDPSSTSKRPYSNVPVTNASSPTSPFTPVSSKARLAAEASSSRREPYTPRSNTLTTLTIPSEGGSSLSPTIPHQSPPDGQGDLLMEVEVLRRELEALRSERNMHDEAPPMYFDGDPPPMSPIRESTPPPPTS